MSVISMKLVINGYEWFTYKQLARKLGVSAQTVYNMVGRGSVIKIDVDGSTYYRLNE